MINLFCRTGVSLIALIHPPEGVDFTWKASFVLALCSLSCLSLIAVNLRQSLALTEACRELKNIGHELKAMYKPTEITTENEREDLNSLLLYTSTLDMEAKLLQIPVRASVLSPLLISLTVVLLLLAQFGYINF